MPYSIRTHVLKWKSSFFFWITDYHHHWHFSVHDNLLPPAWRCRWSRFIFGHINLEYVLILCLTVWCLLIPSIHITSPKQCKLTLSSHTICAQQIASYLVAFHRYRNDLKHSYRFFESTWVYAREIAVFKDSGPCCGWDCCLAARLNKGAAGSTLIGGQSLQNLGHYRCKDEQLFSLWPQPQLQFQTCHHFYKPPGNLGPDFPGLLASLSS